MVGLGISQRVGRAYFITRNYMPKGPEFKNLLNVSNCIDCGELITPENCAYNGRYLRSRCRECWNNHSSKYNKEYKDNNKDKVKKWSLKDKFGITPEQYNVILRFQGNACAICRLACKSGRDLAVDHDHNTGLIRGLLCIRCNNALGSLNEDEDIIWNMLEYLKKHKWSKVS